MENRRKPRVLFAAEYLPSASVDGSSTHMLDIVKYLCEGGCEIEYALLPPPDSAVILIPNEAQRLLTLSVYGGIRLPRMAFRPRRFLPDVRTRVLNWLGRRFKRVLRLIRSAEKPGLENPVTPGIQEFVAKRIREFRPDVMIADYVWFVDLFDCLPPQSGVLRTVLTHDVMFARGEAFCAAGLVETPWHGRWTRERESEKLQKAQLLLAVQRSEAKLLQEMAPRCEVLVTPMAARIRETASNPVLGRCLLVAGAADHNVIGLRWLLREVWPRVVAKVPASHLHVCGYICRGFHDVPRSVRLRGRVFDLAPEYAQCQAVLVPILAGSGLKIKLVEGLAHGKACVSTSIGVQGCEDLAGRGAIVADDPEGFAEGICQLLTDPARRQIMEAEARRYAADNFSPEAAYGPLLDRIRRHVADRSEER
jgi:glycosyltransferase involved in cell wall biosynthesis